MKLIFRTPDKDRLRSVKTILYDPDREELSLLVSDRGRIHFIDDAGRPTTIATGINEVALHEIVSMLNAQHRDDGTFFQDAGIVRSIRTFTLTCDVCPRASDGEHHEQCPAYVKA